MKFKKLPKYLIIALLTFGASLTLGLLSFAGMYTLVPLLGLAAVAFALSVAYEGEIYWQNLKGAVDKLTKKNYLKNLEARKYLVKLALEHKNECSFYQDYAEQLRLVNFYQTHLDEESKHRKRLAEKKLRHMEKWFATLVFDNAPADTPYAQEVKRSITKHGQRQVQRTYLKHQVYYRLSLAFGVVAGVCVGIGTIYLLVQLLPLVGFVSVFPPIVIPTLLLAAAACTGGAYALLIYNTLTNMINNNTIQSWFNNIKESIKQRKIRGFLTAGVAIILTVLAVALTVCTAGTWWTIAGHSIGIALITGISALIFNIENTAESLGVIEHATDEVIETVGKGKSKLGQYRKNPWQQFKSDIGQRFQRYKENKKENVLQMLNPFRLLVTALVLPLRVILFAGHILSIAATADQFPGIPQIFTILLGGICESFEDLHIFFGDHHHHDPNTISDEELLKGRAQGEHGHSHANDIPTRLIKSVLFPIYFLAATWDWGFSRRSDNKITFKRAIERMYGISERKSVNASFQSEQWQRQDMLYQIEKHQAKSHAPIIKSTLAKEKARILSNVKREIIASDDIKATMETAKSEHYATLNKARSPMPFFSNKTTRSAQVFNNLELSVPSA